MFSDPQAKRLVFTALALFATLKLQAADQVPAPATPRSAATTLRFATFNASLNRNRAGALVEDMREGVNSQVLAVAEMIQRVDPDVLLINEFDFDEAHDAARLFQANYLSIAHNGSTPVNYPYVFVAAVNTGLATGFDLNRDINVGGPEDAQGFGRFPGQYGMLVLSKVPIDVAKTRTFQKFLWRDMPGAALPDDPASGEAAGWYAPSALGVLRLSSKSHWDLTLRAPGGDVHLLVSHPTPPAFDGPEDRNGHRNHDEIRFWADYIMGGRKTKYIYDDNGASGGLKGSRFVIMGDQNADPADGSSFQNAIVQLLQHAKVNVSMTPRSDGAVAAAARQGGVNVSQHGDPQFDTADFDDRDPGNLRTDYVLPAKTLSICRSGVFWPPPAHPLARLLGEDRNPTSDHRLVWADISANGTRCQPGSDPTGDTAPRLPPNK